MEFGEIFVKPQLTGDDGYAGLSRFTLVGQDQGYGHHHDGRGDAIVTTMKMAIMVLVVSKFHLWGPTLLCQGVGRPEAWKRNCYVIIFR